MVGLSVTRGRFPGASWLGWPGVSTKDCMRLLNGTPVSPAITDGSQAPLGVAENTLPLRSTTLTQVVSCAGMRDAVETFSIWSGAPKVPGRCSSDACAGSINFARSAAYLFDNRPSSGMCENLGSP